MRRFASYLIGTGLVVAAAMSMQAQSSGNQVTTDVADVTRLEHRFETAHYGKDRAAIGSIFAYDFEGRFPGGITLNKKQAIEALMQPERAGAKSSHERLAVRVIGPVAVVRGECRSELKSQVERVDFVNVWLKREGKWTLVSVTMTLPEKG